MKTLDKGTDKIKKICEILREETLEPAKKEAEKILKDAKNRAEKIVAEAHASALKAHEQAKAEIDQIKNAFEASLDQAAKQAVEALRQAIENHFFNPQLASLVEAGSADPKLVAELINAIVHAIQKEGVSADLSVIIPEKISPKAVNQLVLEEVVKALREKPLQLGKFAGGVEVKLLDKKITIDISDKALRELLASHIVRKEFRKLFFE